MSSLRKGILVYTASNLISTGIPFLILPLLTAYLSKEDYGVLSNFTGLINLLSPIIAFSFVSAFTRVYYKDDVHQEHYTQTGINFQLMLTAGLSILLFLFENYIQELTGIAPVYIRVLALYCFIFSLSELLFTLWRIENKVWTFFFFRMARTFVELGLTLVLITQYGFDYQGRIIAILGSGALLMVVFIPFLLKRRYVGKGMKKEHLNHALRFGIPLIPHAFGAAMISISDKLMISDELGLADNGVYSVAFQVGLIVGLVQNSFNQAWVPWFFQQCKDITHQIRLRIVRITYLYYLGLAIFTLLLYFATPFIYEVLGKEFRAGSELVGWIALGFLFNGMYKMQVNYLFYLERTLMIGVITVVTAAINIVLNWFLIKDYGIKGAAIATCITFLIQLIWVWVFSQRAFPMPWLKGLKKGE